MAMDIKYVPRKRINNQLLKRRRSERSLRRFTAVFLLGLSLVLGMIFSGWVRWKQTEIVYRINQVQAEREKLIEKNRELQTELYKLQAPDRVASIARKLLGMILLKPRDIIFVDVKSSSPVASGTVVAEAQSGDKAGVSGNGVGQ